MLCGLAGSGKTTYAEGLVGAGVIKLSIDESMSEHGVAGVDYPIEDYQALEQTVLERHRAELVGHIAAGTAVALDYGFKTRSERDEYKDLIQSNGGRWRLLYFKVPPEELWRRIDHRNQSPAANAVYIPKEVFDLMLGWFEEPSGEGEEIIEARV
jgi:predicted kinase